LPLGQTLGGSTIKAYTSTCCTEAFRRLQPRPATGSGYQGDLSLQRETIKRHRASFDTGCWSERSGNPVCCWIYAALQSVASNEQLRKVNAEPISEDNSLAF